MGEMTINYFIIFPTAVFPGRKICQLRNINHRLRSGVAWGECDNRRSSVLVCPACDMPSFAPCLFDEAGTRIFAHAMEAA